MKFADERFTAFMTKDGLVNERVWWLSCFRGLSRVSKQQLDDFAEGKIAAISHTAFGKADGMLNTDCNGGR